MCEHGWGGGKLDLIAGGGPKIWGEDDASTEPGGECFVQKAMPC